ncbi:MAG TPA: hypothetical protein VEG38_02055 [Acidimicrobiia bacterium]|nr:hypothetical protein [Acidimicrobiia bacterium]
MSPRPNATHAPDPAAPSSSGDNRFSPDASREAAMVDIPMAPANLAEMKNADPECTIGSGNDHAGTTTAANQRTVRNSGF